MGRAKLMIAIKAHHDGEKVILPEEVQGVPPGDVILVFEHGQFPTTEAGADLIRGQEAAIAAKLSRQTLRKLNSESPGDDV